MSWRKPGALALLKIKETILNNEWDDWWRTERERNIKVGKFKPPLPASYFKKETETSPLIEVTPYRHFQDQIRVNPGWVFYENYPE